MRRSQRIDDLLIQVCCLLPDDWDDPDDLELSFLFTEPPLLLLLLLLPELDDLADGACL
jgi:hypothetical protein